MQLISHASSVSLLYFGAFSVPRNSGAFNFFNFQSPAKSLAGPNLY